MCFASQTPPETPTPAPAPSPPTLPAEQMQLGGGANGQYTGARAADPSIQGNKRRQNRKLWMNSDGPITRRDVAPGGSDTSVGVRGGTGLRM